MLVGTSPPMARIRAIIHMVAPTILPVLVQGPTGAGKEVVAAALHALSGRSGPFVAFNVCAIGDAVFEDALFGHVRGAFTGAVAESPGLLREANGGTLFLDEIGGLQLASQAKLLRAIETKRFRPLGARMDAASDFRVIAATNDRVSDLVATGRFREDLAHRLGAVVIDVPSLRERASDIGLLSEHFLSRLRPGLGLDDHARILLEECQWPGNVRELRQVLESASMWSGSVITREALLAALASRFGSLAPPNTFVHERDTLKQALERNNWDTRVTAQEFGVHRTTVYRLMRRYALSPRQRGRLLNVTISSSST